VSLFGYIASVVLLVTLSFTFKSRTRDQFSSDWLWCNTLLSYLWDKPKADRSY